MNLQLHLEDVPKEATIIVGVSGGRDSMALMHALKEQLPKATLIAAHVNHGLRSSADNDAEFVEGMMARWEIPCETYKPRAPKEGNIEEWGRDKRYDFFEKLRKKHKADFIFTAHHQDDDFESMLLHFLRGTRVKGISGMLPQREQIRRPLLFTPRTEVDGYVEDESIPFREDPTNKDLEFKRNFLRHKVVPVLQHVYPNFAPRWQAQKDYWVELQEMMEESARIFMDDFLTAEGLHRDSYRDLPYPIRATVLELWFADDTGKRIPDSLTLHRWDEAIRTWNSGKKTEWTEGKFLKMTKEWARLA